MIRLLFLIFFMGLNSVIYAQTSHTDGQTTLINPISGGRTLLIEKDNDDSWLTFHDPSDTWYSMGIDVSNSNSFSLNRGGELTSSQFVMDSNGNVGIGIPNPEVKLEVMEEIRLRLGEYLPDKNVARILNLGYSGVTGAMNWTIRGVYQYPNGVGNNSVGGDLDLIKSLNGNTILATNANGLSLGNIGIGTTTPDSKLSVNGNVHAKEVKVDLIGWSDFVFDKDYDLPTLKEVEQHINEKGHLENIPSAKDVKENGVFLGEMDSKLLQKIEELTLYAIDQEKRIETLEATNKKLIALLEILLNTKIEE